MNESKAYLLGGGIGSLAAAAFMIRDGGFSGGNIFVLEAKPLLGGSLDGAGEPGRWLFAAGRTDVDYRQLRMHLGSVRVTVQGGYEVNGFEQSLRRKNG